MNRYRFLIEKLLGPKVYLQTKMRLNRKGMEFNRTVSQSGDAEMIRVNGLPVQIETISRVPDHAIWTCRNILGDYKIDIPERDIKSFYEPI